MEGFLNTKLDPLPAAFRVTIEPLIEELIKPKSLKNELFFALLLVLMKENNFVLIERYEGDAISIKDYILQLRTKTSRQYNALFKLNGKDLHVRVIASFLNDIVLINAIILELFNETFSLCLLTYRYMSLSEQFDIPTKFMNLEELTLLFKDKIITSVKSVVLNYYNTPGCSFGGIPEEVAHEIMIRLPVSDIVNIAKTCKRLSDIVKQDSLWCRLLKRDFPKETKDAEKCFFETYKELYVMRGIERQNCVHEVENTFREHVRYSRVRSDSTRWEVIL